MVTKTRLKIPKLYFSLFRGIQDFPGNIIQDPRCLRLKTNEQNKTFVRILMSFNQKAFQSLTRLFSSVN